MGLGGGEVLAVQTSQCTRRRKHKTVHDTTRHDTTRQDTERHHPTCCLSLQQGDGLGVLGKTSRQINTGTRQDSPRQGKTRQHGPQAHRETGPHLPPDGLQQGDGGREELGEEAAHVAGEVSEKQLAGLMTRRPCGLAVQRPQSCLQLLAHLAVRLRVLHTSVHVGKRGA